MKTFAAAIALAAFGAGATGPVLAGDRGSMEDQLACTPDVYRLCSSFVPDEDAIVACLKKNIQLLSPGCHRVFSEPGRPKTEEDGDE